MWKVGADAAHQNLGGMCEAGLGFGWSEAGVGDEKAYVEGLDMG